MRIAGAVLEAFPVAGYQEMGGIYDRLGPLTPASADVIVVGSCGPFLDLVCVTACAVEGLNGWWMLHLCSS